MQYGPQQGARYPFTYPLKQNNDCAREVTRSFGLIIEGHDAHGCHWDFLSQPF